MTLLFRRLSYLWQLLVNMIRQQVTGAAPVITAMDEHVFDPIFTKTFATVLDIGAHAGEFSALVHKWLPKAKILAFEPLQGPYTALQRVIECCGNHSRAYPIALGESAGTAQMTEFPFTPCSSLLPASRGTLAQVPYMIGGVERTVTVGRLDDVLRNEDIVRPALMKIDVQGFEDRVLRGGESILQLIDVLVIETSMVRLYDGQWLFDDMRSWLERRGFTYTGALQRHRATFGGTVLQEDSLFVR